VNGQPSLATNHGDQAKNNVKDAAGQGSDQRDRVVSLNLVVSKKAANLAVPREREPESQAECNKKNRTGDLQLSPLSAQRARPKIVALETDKSIPHIQPASNYHSGCQRLPRPRHLVRAPDGPPRRRLRRYGRHRRRPRFGRRGLSHHAGPAHRRSLGIAGMRLQSATFWRARPSAPIRWNSCRLRQWNER
jgi:hypothetical protein